MNLRSLKYFLAVAEEKNISRAAEAAEKPLNLELLQM